MKAFRSLGHGLLVAVIITLAACGGDVPPDRVDYQDTTLIVNGARYERLAAPPAGGVYLPNDVMVGFKPGRLQEGLKLMEKLKLPVASTLTSLEMVEIKVPAGFEAQWVSALVNFDVVRLAARNAEVKTTGPVAVGEAGPVR